MDNKKVAIIGSGPISLFEAIYQSKLGNDVTIFEERDRLGGAWANIEYSKGLSFELGCHIWDIDKKTYLFIEKFLGERLKPLKPSPLIKYKNRAFPYDWKNNILLLKALKNGFKRYILSKKNIKYVFIPRKYKYPLGGSKQLLEKLLSEVYKLNIEIRLKEEVKSVELEEDDYCLELNKGFFKANQLIVTALTGFKSIKQKEYTILPNYKTTSFYHFHLILDENITKKLPYIRVMDHKFIHRISDMSDYSDLKKQVLVIGVFKEKIKGMLDDEIVGQIKEYLVKNCWIEGNRKILEYYSNEYKTKKIDNIDIKKIRNNKNFYLLSSNNLIFGLSKNIERWEKVLFN